jgi:hypothetical protein
VKRNASPHEFSDLKIVVVADGDATVAVTSFEGVTYTASAKRCPGDKYDENIGFELAVSRLLGKISSALARQGNGAVKHADDVRSMKQARKAAMQARVEEALAMGLPGGRHQRPVGPDPDRP